MPLLRTRLWCDVNHRTRFRIYIIYSCDKTTAKNYDFLVKWWVGLSSLLFFHLPFVCFFSLSLLQNDVVGKRRRCNSVWCCLFVGRECTDWLENLSKSFLNSHTSTRKMFRYIYFCIYHKWKNSCAPCSIRLIHLCNLFEIQFKLLPWDSV